MKTKPTRLMEPYSQKTPSPPIASLRPMYVCDTKKEQTHVNATDRLLATDLRRNFE